MSAQSPQPRAWSGPATGLDREVRPHDQRSHLGTAAGQASKLAVLLDALDGVVISDAERASLAWLAGFEKDTVENLAAVIGRARRTGSPDRGAGS